MYEIFMYARQHFFMIILINLLFTNSISDYNVIVTLTNKKIALWGRTLVHKDKY